MLARPRLTACANRAGVMEIFTFMRMGGSRESIDLHSIWDDEGSEGTEKIIKTFKKFDAAKAQCFLAKDRQNLLAVIEAGFGDFVEFDKQVRDALLSRAAGNEFVHVGGASTASAKVAPMSDLDA